MPSVLSGTFVSKKSFSFCTQNHKIQIDFFFSPCYNVGDFKTQGGVSLTRYDKIAQMKPEQKNHWIDIPELPPWNERIFAEIAVAEELNQKESGKYDQLLEQAVDCLYRSHTEQHALPDSVCEEAEKILLPLGPAAKALTMHCVAHAHIDMDWMWGYHETVDVALNTFRTMLDLMNEYPDFTFSQSQAAVYRIAETYDPAVPNDLVYTGKFRLTDTVPGCPLTVGKLVLSPTRTYAPVIKAMLEEHRGDICGMIHCSGGAQTKILHFIDRLHVVKDHLFETPLLFRLIQRESQTPWKEMFSVFNMGHRMELYVDDETVADDLIRISQSFGIDAQVVGHVEASEKASVTILHEGQEYTYFK